MMLLSRCSDICVHFGRSARRWGSRWRGGGGGGGRVGLIFLYLLLSKSAAATIHGARGIHNNDENARDTEIVKPMTQTQ